MIDWARPEPSDVARTLASLGEPALRQLFFQELENPEWLEPLRELGAFADPGVSESPEGLRAWPWPEGEYLRRMAEQRPAEVLAVAVTLTGSTNPWVRRLLVEICAALPAEHVAPIAGDIANLVAKDLESVDPSRLADIAEGLLVAGRDTAAKKLLRVMFEPRPGEKEEWGLGSHQRLASALDEYWYRELLARLAPNLARLEMSGLRLVTGWLMRGIEIRSGGDSQPNSIWRPSIASHEQNLGGNAIDDALVDAVRDVGIAVTASSGSREAVDFLNSKEGLLLRRVAAEIVASAATVETPDLIAVGVEMLLDPALADIDARPEYAHLAKALLPHLNQAQARAVADFLLSTSWIDDEVLVRLAARSPDEEPTESELDEQRRRLLHRMLASLRPAVHGELASRLTQLDAEFGELVHPEFSMYVSGFHGPVSPKTVSELLAFNAEQLLDFLRNWTPPDSFMGPSVGGLARELEEAVTSSPTQFERLSSVVTELRPAYVRAIVAGWAKAIPRGYTPGAETWRALAALAYHERDAVAAEERYDPDDDPRWQWVHQALVAVVRATADREPELDALEAGWSVIKPLLDHFDPSPDRERQYGGDNMDPLTLSLNTVRPDALRGAIRLLRATLGNDQPRAEELRREVLSEIRRHAAPDSDPSLAVAAALGEGIGPISGADSAWATELVQAAAAATVSGDVRVRAWSDAFISVAVVGYPPGADVLALLRPALATILSAEYLALEHTEGWRGHQTTLSSALAHVLWALAHGRLAADDALVAAMFNGAVGVAPLAEAIGQVGWQLMHAISSNETLSAEMLARLRHLVETRLDAAQQGTGSYDELTQFYWWVKSGAFEITWWLPILSTIIEAGVALDKTFLGEALEAAVHEDPRTALAVFSHLAGQGEYWSRFDLLQHAAPIIVGGLQSSDDDAVEMARAQMDLLGRQGRLDILEAVEQLLAQA